MDVLSLPLVKTLGLNHKGSYTHTSGVMDYPDGQFCFSEDKKSIFVCGLEDYIAEYHCPDFDITASSRLDLKELKLKQAPVQIGGGLVWNSELKRKVYPRFDIKMDSERFRICGMHHKNGKLYINHMNWYDALNSRDHTTIVVEDASDLAGSEITHDYAIDGRTRQAGAIQEIPKDYQSFFGGEFTTWTPCASVISRFDIGPGMRAFNYSDFDKNNHKDGLKRVSGSLLMEYSSSRKNPDGTPQFFYDKDEFSPEIMESLGLLGYTNNNRAKKEDGSYTYNKWWSTMSRVCSAFVIEGTRTLVVISDMYGATREPLRKNAVTLPTEQYRGIGYKEASWRYIWDKKGYEIDYTKKSGGNSVNIEDDVCHNIFLFDLKEIERVKNKDINPWDVRPYKLLTMSQPVNISYDRKTLVPNAGQYNYETKELTLCYKRVIRLGRYDIRNMFSVYSVDAVIDDVVDIPNTEPEEPAETPIEEPVEIPIETTVEEPKPSIKITVEYENFPEGEELPAVTVEHKRV